MRTDGASTIFYDVIPVCCSHWSESSCLWHKRVAFDEIWFRRRYLVDIFQPGCSRNRNYAGRSEKRCGDQREFPRLCHHVIGTRMTSAWYLLLLAFASCENDNTRK